jgi:cardiolipin synthase A/B
MMPQTLAARPVRRDLRGRFPRAHGNAFTVIGGGEPFYADLLAAIRAARHELLFCTYLWTNDTTGRVFLGEVEAAARRGVRVAVLVDGVGSFSLTSAQLQAIRDAGGLAAVHQPLRHAWGLQRLMRRNHRKNIVIDGHIAWVGGAGIADEWLERWWDVMVRVEGPVADQLRLVFRRDWLRTTRTWLPDLPVTGDAPPRHPGREVLRALPSGLTRREMLGELLIETGRVQDRVWIASAYFVPGFWLRRRLRRAARRGVDVRVLVPGPETDHRPVWFAGRRHYGKLLAAGVRVFEYRKGLMHAKYALVDDRWGCVGSSNLDAWSARYNYELDIEVTSRGGVAALVERFEADAAQAREIELERWRNRPYLLRLAEQVFGWIDPLL